MSLPPRCAVHTTRHQGGCPDCRRYGREYARERERRIARGRWDPILTGEQIAPVRAHLVALLEQPGVTVPKAAATAGFHHMALYRLLDGRTVQLWPATAQAILALSADRIRSFVQSPLIDSTGLARRLQALAVEQWGSREIAGLTPYTVDNIRHWRQRDTARVRRTVHETIADLYEKLLGLPDPLGPSVSVGRAARQAGYLGPERWDDETIDDPDAQPLPLLPDAPDPVELRLQVQEALRLRTPGAGSGWPREVKKGAAVQAREAGWSVADVGVLLGLSTSGAEYLLSGRKDRPHTRQR